jgi:excisionase family DNA binding protein
MNEGVVSLEPVAVRRQTAAKMLDCSDTTVWRLVQTGVLKTIKIGADDRITVDSIRALVQQRAAA